MVLVNLGNNDLEIGNTWHAFTALSVTPGDVIPARISLISPDPDQLISKAILRYSLNTDGIGSDDFAIQKQFNIWYNPLPQIVELAVPLYFPDVTTLTIEARRFYRFRSINPGSTMNLQIEYETDDVYNLDTTFDKFDIFTHGAIAANTVGVLDFAGITEPYRIYSVWLDMTGALASDAMEITINTSGNVTSYWNLTLDEVPWQPPPNIVTSATDILLRPTADVSNVILYAKPAVLNSVTPI